MSSAALLASAQQIENYRTYRYTLLSSARIRSLSTLKPSQAIADIGVCWAFILAAFTIVAVHPAWWTVLIAIPVIGNRYYGLFIVGHDGMHRRLFPTVQRNDFWNDLLILAPIGAITRINNANHMLHHRHLATQEDPDRRKYGCFNKSTRAEVAKYLSGLLSVWVSGKAVYFTHRKSQSVRSGNSRPNEYTMRDFAMLAGWFCALAGGLTWSIGWWAYPVLWLFPVYAFMFLGDNFRSFAEHSHPENDQTADAHRLITYTSNPIERMFVAPMNMNFHTVHHLWPSIPYYNLPIADREIRGRAQARGLEWRKSYFGYLLSYWMTLPIAGCRQGR